VKIKKSSFLLKKSIEINNKKFKFYSLKKAEENGLEGISKLPKSLKVLLENLLSYSHSMVLVVKEKENISYCNGYLGTY